MLLETPPRIRSIIGISPVPASGFPLEGEMWELFAGAEKNPGNRRAIIDNTTGGTGPQSYNGTWIEHAHV
ncbi:hypothetical protein AB0K23_11335 [Streptomyces sp. NPDC049602]|uniref:hypothetical protein n=1 Tax=Streptomyces sp. NPDC049602 TaxID=3155504 RepID=UPI003431AB25